MTKQALVNSYSQEYHRVNSTNSQLDQKLRRVESLSLQSSECASTESPQGQVKGELGQVIDAQGTHSTLKLRDLREKLLQTEAELEGCKEKSKQDSEKSHERLMVRTEKNKSLASLWLACIHV